jgi:hypothetical protein
MAVWYCYSNITFIIHEMVDCLGYTTFMYTFHKLLCWLKYEINIFMELVTAYMNESKRPHIDICRYFAIYVMLARFPECFTLQGKRGRCFIMLAGPSRCTGYLHRAISSFCAAVNISRGLLASVCSCFRNPGLPGSNDCSLSLLCACSTYHLLSPWQLNDTETVTFVVPHILAGGMHYATSRKVAGSIADEVIGFFNWPNPSSALWPWGRLRLVTEMSTRNLPGGKWRPAGKADNFTTISEPIVYKMWEPRCLTAIWAFTACYRDDFTF